MKRYVKITALLLMILAIRTKTVKDAQSAVTPISLGVLVPGMAPAFVPPSGLLAYLIPGYGATAVLGDIAATGSFPVVAISPNSASTPPRSTRGPTSTRSVRPSTTW